MGETGFICGTRHQGIYEHRWRKGALPGQKCTLHMKGCIAHSKSSGCGLVEVDLVVG